MTSARATHGRLTARILGGTAAGAAAAILVIVLADMGVHALGQPAPAARLGTVVIADRPLATLSFPLRLMLIAGWAVASFVGNAVAAGIVGRRWAVWPIAVLVVVGVAETVAGYTHPAWMIALGLLLPWPCAWAATRFARHA